MRFPRSTLPRAPRRAFLALALGALAAALLPAAEAGDDAPKFANPDLKGNYVASSKVVGRKWVIVSFFATWCVPCKEELPTLEALQLEAGADKLQVLVFATDKEKEKVKEFFEQKPTNLTVLLDPYQVAYLRYNAAEDGLPTIFLLNPQGKIEAKHIGYSPEFIKELRGKILPAGTP
jgi:thiol-disulfide isomerase/thioredoxin